MTIQLSVPDWLRLSNETRLKLVEIFSIPRSTGSQMDMIGGQGVIKSDGHTHQDLSVITVEKMQLFLNTDESDFLTLFQALIKKLEEEKELVIAEEPNAQTLIIEEWGATLRRLKGQAVEKDMLPFLTETIKQVFEIQTIKIKENDNASQGLPAKRGRPKTK